MIPDPVSPEQPSVMIALERVLSASQQLVVDRLDLLILEAKEGLIRGLQAAVVGAVAVGVLFCGWLCINASLAVFFKTTSSLSGILAVLAAVNLGVGFFVVAAARHLAAPTRKREEGRSRPEKGAT